MNLQAVIHSLSLRKPLYQYNMTREQVLGDSAGFTSVSSLQFAVAFHLAVHRASASVR